MSPPDPRRVVSGALDSTCGPVKAGKLCFAASEPCDIDDVCDGADTGCPSLRAADGTPCDDGDPCTTGDTCQGGWYAKGTPITCPAQDQCHVDGVCDSTTGACSTGEQLDGTPCDAGDRCTTHDACVKGWCARGLAVTCPAQDECHRDGTCDPQSGACDPVAWEDGTACTGGVCKDGACVPTSDAGTPVETPQGGCSCRQSGGEPLPLGAGLMLAGLVARRRRRAR